MDRARRRFLIGGLAVASLAVLGGFAWTRRDPRAVIVAILERRVGYLPVERETLRTFATDYIRSRAGHEAELARMSLVAPFLRIVSPYSWLRHGHPLRRLEDNVVSTFLLSTDFFQEGANESRPPRYLGFYDPYSRPCGNPFVPPRA